MSSHTTTKLWFNTIFQNRMRSKIWPASIKHVSYSIVVYGTELVRCSNNRQHPALCLVLEKYLCTSLASALAACRQLCVVHSWSHFPAQHRSTATRWVPTRKLMMVLKVLGTAWNKYILYTVSWRDCYWCG